MTLGKMLEKLKPETMVFLGAKTAFFEICPAAELLDEIETLSHKMDQENIRIRNESRLRTIRMARKFSGWDQTWEGNLEDSLAGLNACREEIVGKLNKNQLKALHDYALMWKSRTEMIDCFVPLRDRQVVDMYPRAIHKDGVVVLVEGRETGRWWMPEERTAPKIRARSPKTDRLARDRDKIEERLRAGDLMKDIAVDYGVSLSTLSVFVRSRKMGR